MVAQVGSIPVYGPIFGMPVIGMGSKMPHICDTHNCDMRTRPAPAPDPKNALVTSGQ